MFHFPALPPHRLYIHRRVTRHHSCRVSPFGHPRIHARLAAPRGISQPPTSFIGSRCQGIHHAPLNTYKSQKPRNKNCKTNKTKASLVRCSQPLSTKQTPHPTTKMERQHTHPHKGAKTGLLPQDPTVCPATTGQHHPRRDRAGWRSKLLLYEKQSAPPTTHYRRRRKISQPHYSHMVWGRGKNGAP